MIGATLLGLIAAATMATLLAGRTAHAIEFLYLFPVLFAFYRLDWLAAAAVLTASVASYAAALVSLGVVEPIRVLFVAISLAGVGSGLRLLANRERNLIASLATVATTDPLTGLMNRRGFGRRFDSELARATRDRTPLTLLVVDLDDFKLVNDRLGHLGGDTALERVSAVAQQVTRPGDDLARLGGEEFALILPATGEIQGLAIAERFRTRLAESFAETPIALTASIGVAQFPDHGRSLEQLLLAADRAMYAAKSLGKNRSVISSPEVDQVLADRAATAGSRQSADRRTPSVERAAYPSAEPRPQAFDGRSSRSII